MKNYTLYGDSRSGNCYKVAAILRLTQRPFDWVEMDVMKGVTRTPEFLGLNPNGKVPLLVLPDGRPLSESNAMLLHLSEGTSYLPDDVYDRALVYQWLFFEQYSHEPYIAVARFLILLAGLEHEEAERIRVLHEKGNQALMVMEQHLSNNRFLVGECLTVADIALYAYTHDAGAGGFDLGPYSAIRRWLKEVHAWPGMMNMQEACC